MTARDSWVREFEVDGETYRATFVRRPFREGLEVVIDLPAGPLRLAELGLREQALLEKATRLIRATRTQKE